MAQRVPVSRTLRTRFTGGQLMFDAFTAFMVKTGPLLHPTLRKQDVRLRWGLRDNRELEQWCGGILLLSEWFYFDQHEPRLGAQRLLRWVPGRQGCQDSPVPTGITRRQGRQHNRCDLGRRARPFPRPDCCWGSAPPCDTADNGSHADRYALTKCAGKSTNCRWRDERKGESSIETYTLSASQGSVLGDYQQVLHWTVKDKTSRSILLQILGIPVFILLGFAFSILAIHIGKLPDTLKFGILEIGICSASIVATIALHELVHGLTMQRYGARPQYGVLWKQLMFYATSPGYGFQRNSYILVALAPLVGLSCLAVLGMFLLQGTDWVALLTLCGVINGSGALGDLWLVSIVLRYPKIAYIVDERDGIRVLLPSCEKRVATWIGQCS
jgi:hypothetical protein